MGCECACGNHSHEKTPEAGDIRMATPPRGVRVSADTDAICVKARSVGFNWGAIAALLFAAAWSAFWANEVISVFQQQRAGTLGNAGPEITIRIVVLLIGVYCFALVLWTLFGHERLMIRNGRLWLSSPWRFGGFSRSYDLRGVKSFQCAHKDCGAEHDSCCCGYSTVDYTLSFAAHGHPVSIFPHLSRETKDWVRDWLNQALSESRARM